MRNCYFNPGPFDTTIWSIHCDWPTTSVYFAMTNVCFVTRMPIFFLRKPLKQHHFFTRSCFFTILNMNTIEVYCKRQTADYTKQSLKKCVMGIIWLATDPKYFSLCCWNVIQSSGQCLFVEMTLWIMGLYVWYIQQISEIHLHLKSREISCVLIIKFSCPITLKSCIKQSLWRTCSVKNFQTIEQLRNTFYASTISFNTSFEGIYFIQTVRWIRFNVENKCQEYFQQRICLSIML